jgi:hypothetical protein
MGLPHNGAVELPTSDFDVGYNRVPSFLRRSTRLWSRKDASASAVRMIVSLKASINKKSLDTELVPLSGFKELKIRYVSHCARRYDETIETLNKPQHYIGTVPTQSFTTATPCADGWQVRSPVFISGVNLKTSSSAIPGGAVFHELVTCHWC